MIFKKPQKFLPLTPDQHFVKKPPPLLQITPNFLISYRFSHTTTLKKKDVVFLGQDQMGPALTLIFGIKIVQFLLQAPILLYRGHSWMISKAFIDTSWHVVPYNFWSFLLFEFLIC